MFATTYFSLIKGHFQDSSIPYREKVTVGIGHFVNKSENFIIKIIYNSKVQ